MSSYQPVVVVVEEEKNHAFLNNIRRINPKTAIIASVRLYRHQEEDLFFALKLVFSVQSNDLVGLLPTEYRIHWTIFTYVYCVCCDEWSPETILFSRYFDLWNKAIFKCGSFVSSANKNRIYIKLYKIHFTKLDQIGC